MAFPRVPEIQLAGFALGNATTSPPLALAIAAEIVAPIVSTARRIGSTSRCAYLAVVAGWLCPRSLPMIGKPNDAPAPTDAKLCRRSWMRKPSSPAAAVIAAQGFLRSDRGAPSFSPGIMCGLPPIRGRADRTSRAAADRKTDFLPVFEVGKFINPRSKSTYSHFAVRISKASPGQDQSRTAAIANGSSLRRRFSGFGACFAFGFASSTV